MNIYAQNILDRYKNPLHKDQNLDTKLHCKEANHSCGDVVEINLKIDGDKVSDYSFSGNGCAISMASADMIGDLAEGMSKEEILKLTKEEIYEMLGIEISMRRSKCALLPLLALQNAFPEEARTWSDYHL